MDNFIDIIHVYRFLPVSPFFTRKRADDSITLSVVHNTDSQCASARYYNAQYETLLCDRNGVLSWSVLFTILIYCPSRISSALRAWGGAQPDGYTG